MRPDYLQGRLQGDDSHGLWPSTLERPIGLVRYKPARFTQRIYNQGEVTERIQRSGLEEKWNVPGGMAGLSGWKSEVYRFVPSPPKVWRGGILVKNSLPPPDGWQWERGWKREYPDGTYFADVLSANGVFFEVRYREKIGGRWSNFVAYKNVAARPAGYHGLTMQACTECHNQAGSGSYGVGLVPGGDETISDQFEALES